ncbi:alpha/beta fold hydrolase [Aestuariivirga sp.]|uniref:alpha/beta hydrolase family protein n=1 Tax=Aestuariivirga sp. TaxID=2650926 RepID=UPI003BABF696
MKFYFDDADYDDQLKRTASAAYCGAADLGEMLVAASAVTPGDPASWHDQWSAAAMRAEALATKSPTDDASTAGAWLRAAEYWRQAFFYLRGDLGDTRLLTCWKRHRAAFRAAVPHLPVSCTIASIPFDGCHLTGYLLRPAGAVDSRATVVLPAGYDSTAECGYVETAWMALERGFNAFTIEGPGQGGALYEDHVPMRPDYESVLAPALDWLEGQQGVDRGRIALVGRSYAGYLAPRAAAVEHRIAALVCDPGQVEFVSRITGMLSRQFASAGGLTWQMIEAASPATDALLEQVRSIPAMRDMLAPRMVTLGARTVGDFLRKQGSYTLDGKAALIRCPTLVVDCEGDFASQSDMLFAALTCPKQMIRLNAQSGAGGHCGGLGQQVWAAAVFPWLAEALAERAN